MKFRVLGPLEVWSGDDWTAINAAKWRSLFACLLLRPGQLVPTENLIFELWGDSPPAKANNLVSIYVHRLRRLIGDTEGRVLVYRAPGYMLRIGPGDLDLQEFESLVADGRNALSAADPESAAALLAEALGMWRGPLLSDVTPSALIMTESERAVELQLAAAELRIEADVACGRSAQVIPELRRLVAENPIREGLWLLLIRALDEAGRHAEALETYAQARVVISDELGVNPGSELQQLYAQLLAADASSAPPHKRPSGATPATETNYAVEKPSQARVVPSAERPDQARDGRDGAAADEMDAEILFGGAPSTISIGTFTELALAPAALTEGPVGPPMSRPAQLPADIGDFTGRAVHVQDVREMLARGDTATSPGVVRIAVIAGAAGLGKTTLAVHTAHQVRALFPDGQLYVDLMGASAQPPAPGEVLARFLRDLGIDGDKVPTGDDERAALYRARLTGRRVLVVLDNARDAVQVRPLLPGSASCAVLVTTRNSMPDLISTRLVDLNVLEDTEALALFSRIVGHERTTAEPDAAAKVLLACAGLPLAIRICAARLAARRQWSIATMANRLRDERRRLDEMKTGDLAVRASFQVTFDSLRSRTGVGDIDPARAFCLLGLWQHPTISLRAAAVLIGRPEDEVADVLEGLVDANLLDSPEPDEYRLHDLLRVYAMEQAEAELSAQERIVAISRLSDSYHYNQAITPSDRRQVDEGDYDSTAAHGPIKVLDRPRTLSAHSGALIENEAQATPTSSPARPNPDGDLLVARQPDHKGPISEEQPKTLSIRHDGEIKSQAVEHSVDRISAGTQPGSRAPGNDFRKDSEPQAVGEGLLTVLRAILVAQGITEREQVAAFAAALIRSWPGRPGYAGPTLVESRWEPIGMATPAPVTSIPDAPGYDLRPDPLTGKTPADLVRALARLRQWAGNPPFREMERRCGHEVASATICTALASDKLPSERVVLAIVIACGGDEEQMRAFNTAWRKLEMAQEPGRHQGKRQAKRKLYPIPDSA